MACPVCGDERFNVYLPATLGAEPPIFGYKWTPDIRKSYRFVSCRSCRHVRASPRLADMARYYEDNADPAYIANSPLRAATAEAVIRTIRKYAPGGRLLDVGCATGDFLQVAGAHYDVEGIELSKWARDIAQMKGLRVTPQSLEDMGQDAQRFDVVTLWGVIEHLEHPIEELERIHGLLRSDGILCIWTGDVRSLSARILGRRWWYVIGQHLQLFSRASLDAALKRSGFRIVYSGTYPYVINLRYLGERLSVVLGSTVKSLLGSKLLRDIRLQLRVPGEIFCVYRKM